eukprot:TRINITY_DN48604_c0_g1_i1.p2 TRINITY_DN48604_c0_g1~~TRINITY_DN48604_c0_g1_i1.p2  ORF type:complete len:177 (-),score=11.34 TRINITY_DN48604_c0_g1_i1:220-750(-)
MVCRMCSTNMLGMVFGDDVDRKSRIKSQRRQSDVEPVTSFNPRSRAEMEAAIEKWFGTVHPRARTFFGTEDALREILGMVAECTSEGDDPIFSSNATCVKWHGSRADDDQPVIHIIKPNESVQTESYVNRVLVFIFSAEESFERLMQLPKLPFKMACGDQHCVNIAHVQIASYRGR